MLSSFPFNLLFCISTVLPLIIHHGVSLSRQALRCQTRFLCKLVNYNLFSFFTSIYLLIKSTLIISKNPVLLELTHPLLVSVDLSSFRYNCLQILFFYFCFFFLFQFVTLLRMILVFFLHLLTL